MVLLDHVVYFSEKSPEVNVQEHKGTTIGGKHKNWGTFNALTYTHANQVDLKTFLMISLAPLLLHLHLQLFLLVFLHFSVSNDL